MKKFERIHTKILSVKISEIVFKNFFAYFYFIYKEYEAFEKFERKLLEKYKKVSFHQKIFSTTILRFGKDQFHNAYLYMLVFLGPTILYSTFPS